MNPQQNDPDTNMLPEYDLDTDKGVRGKYHPAYMQGHTVKILYADGKVTTQYFIQEIDNGRFQPKKDDD